MKCLVALKEGISSLENSLNILHMSTEKLLTLLNFTFIRDNVPGRSVIFNCGNLTEKCSEFLDYHLKPVMQNSWSYLKDSGDFLKKMKNISSIPEDTILVTADVVGLYPSIPHTASLAALRDALDNREVKKIPKEDLVSLY